MNRREAVIAGLTSIAAAAAVAPRADAETSEGTNPDLDQIRALLRAHDEAFTNQDLGEIMACMADKAAIMGTGPGEIWSGPDEIKVAYQHFFEGGWINGRRYGGGGWINGGGGGWINRRGYGGGGSWVNRW